MHIGKIGPSGWSDWFGGLVWLDCIECALVSLVRRDGPVRLGSDRNHEMIIRFGMKSVYLFLFKQQNLSQEEKKQSGNKKKENIYLIMRRKTDS